MADNPFYPGYNPADDVNRIYPGKGMARMPAYRAAPSFQFGNFGEGFNILMDEIDAKLRPDLEKGNLKFVNIPKWMWDRTVDDMKQALMVHVYPSKVDPIAVDDYEPGTVPGASGLSLNVNPVDWAKDPGKILSKTAKSYARIVFDPDDMERRARERVWDTMMKEDPTQRDSALTGIDRTIQSQYLAEASRYGLGGDSNPLALHGLNVIRKEKAQLEEVFENDGTVTTVTEKLSMEPGLAGWTGRDKGHARIKIQTTTASTAGGVIGRDGEIMAGGFLVEKQVDTGERMGAAFIEWQRYYDSPLYRARKYHEFLATTTDFVATDLHNLYQRRSTLPAAERLSAEDTQFIENYLAMAHFKNVHEDTGSAYKRITDKLDSQRMPDGNTVRVVETNDAKQNIIKIQIGSASAPTPSAGPAGPETTMVAAPAVAAGAAKKPVVLLSYNETTGKYGGTIYEFFEKLEKDKETFTQTRAILARNGDAKMLADFDKMTRTIEGHMDELLGRFGILETLEGGRARFIPSEYLQALLDDPSKANIQKLRFQLETYMGVSDKALLGKGLWGFNSLRESPEATLDRYLGYGLLAESDSKFRKIAQEHGLHSARAELYAKIARRQEGFERVSEIYNAWKGGKMPENYGWTQGMKTLFRASSLAANPNQIIQYGLSKINYFGAQATDDGTFDETWGKGWRNDLGVNRLLENGFSIELEDAAIGQKWKTTRMVGGAHFAAVKDLQQLSKLPGGKETLEKLLIQGLPIVIERDGKLFLSEHYLHAFFPNGIPTDPEELQKALRKLKVLQEQAEEFKKWVHGHLGALGIREMPDIDLYMQLIDKLNKQSVFLNITRQYAGWLEKIVAFGNRLQAALFEKLGVSRFVQAYGLQNVAIKKAIQEAIVVGLEKAAAKLGLHAISQSIGSAAPGIGNAVAFVATMVAEKIVNTAVSVAKSTVGSAWDLIVKGEAKDVMAEVDEAAVKTLKIVAVVILLLLLVSTVIFGGLGALVSGILMLGPNGLGTVFGSATLGSQQNLASNPYIVMLSTFSDIDPTRQHSLMTQEFHDWEEYWPLPGASGYPTGIPGGEPIPGVPSIDWGEEHLECFLEGTPPPHYLNLPRRDMSAIPSPTNSNAISDEMWTILADPDDGIRLGFWCWNNFSPRYCDWNDANPRRCDNIFFWDEFIQHPNHCYHHFTWLYPGCTGESSAIAADDSLFWCGQLVHQAYRLHGISGEVPITNAINMSQVAAFQSMGRLRAGNAPNHEDALVSGDAAYTGGAPQPDGSPPAFVSHVAAVHSVSEDYVGIMQTNTGYQFVYYAIAADGYAYNAFNARAWYYGLSVTGDPQR
ncbi:hypothetical protein JXA34_03600 [Patescibacteria group bacterium]|nr:hypothetical protein [Patescibacteria group bacterium]